jgi:hypothetical protein
VVFLQVAAKDVGEKECGGDEYYYAIAEMRQYTAAWSVCSNREGKRCFTVRHKHKKHRHALARASGNAAGVVAGWLFRPP